MKRTEVVFDPPMHANRQVIGGDRTLPGYVLATPRQLMSRVVRLGSKHAAPVQVITGDEHYGNGRQTKPAAKLDSATEMQIRVHWLRFGEWRVCWLAGSTRDEGTRKRRLSTVPASFLLVGVFSCALVGRGALFLVAAQ
jgi:hypothetical protein